MRTLDWTHESNPGWDGTGTVADSWYVTENGYACRIDRFIDGGYAYTVEYDGNPVRNGENEDADSFGSAEAAVYRLTR